MRFRFSLQPVLEQRMTVEELRQRLFAQAQAAVEEVRREMRAIDQDILARKDQVQQGQLGGMHFAMRRMIEDWIDAQTARRGTLTVKVHELEAKAEQERQQLVKAAQARIALEKLREQELKAWRLEEARAEMKQFDEIAVRNAAMERRAQRRTPADPAKIAEQPERIAP